MSSEGYIPPQTHFKSGLSNVGGRDFDHQIFKIFININICSVDHDLYYIHFLNLVDI